MKKTLYIDTHSTLEFQIAFYDLESLQTKTGKDPSIEMIEAIRTLCKLDFEQIIINKGPGSLTGLRIGSSFAQGISLAKNIPVYALSIWDMVFAEHPECEVFFFTGTKKWIKKTAQNEQILEQNELSSTKKWTSNKPNLLQNLPKENYIPFLQHIDLMHKHRSLASTNISLLYPINLFKI